jgi:predicted nucleotidyltransferase
MGYTSASLRERREEIFAAAARHGAHSVRGFGSVARGQAGASSDVDFLVDMGDESTLFDRAALLVELRELLGCDVDVVTAEALKPRLRERILAEAVPL